MSLVLVVLALLLLAPICITFLFSRIFIYYRSDLPDEMVAAFAATHGFEVTRLEVEPGIELVGAIKPATSTTAPTILFFGGNAADIGSNMNALALIGQNTENGAVVFAYRGYDGSGGKPSEEALVGDAEKIVSHLATLGVTKNRLVIVGQSLGTGVSGQLTARLCRSEQAPKKLVLLAPFRSLASIFDQVVPVIPVGWTVPDRFDTEKVVNDINVPVLIVHGIEDEMIPIAHGRALARAFERAEIVELAGRGHNDIFDDEKAVAAIQNFVGD